jgi:hypothetical protein
MTDKKMVIIQVEGDETKALIEVGFLQSHGIEALIQEDDAGNQLPSLESTQGVKILVSEAQAELARSLLSERDTAD